MTNSDSKRHSEGQREIDRLKEAMDFLRNMPPDRAISAMPVTVVYTAKVGRVEHYKRGEEHYFKITRAIKEGSPDEEWEEKPLNALAVRDEFLRIQDWSGAYDFLAATGRFSPLNDTVRWSEFQRWQHFARLVLEHNELASAMQSGDWNGQNGDVLKALTGDYASRFFESLDEPVSPQDAEGVERLKQVNPKITLRIEEGKRLQEQKRRELRTWFRRPPGKACSIEWFPKRKEDAEAVFQKLRAGGAMIEFLLPREALRPALVIYASNTLEAIAAAIYADHSNGVEYRTCEFCNKLFPVGRQKSKRFCNQRQCKNAAHSRKVRQHERERKMLAKAKKKTPKILVTKRKAPKVNAGGE